MIDRRTVMMSAAAVAAAGCATATNQTESRTREEALSGFAVNTESWYLDQPFKARFDAAARAGFTHVEFWSLNDDDRRAEDLARIIGDAGLSVAQIVGGSPALALTASRAGFLEECRVAVDRANTLQTDVVTIVGHQDVDGVSASDSLKAYTDHMAAAAPIFEDARVFAAIEPFNPYDHPGHFVNGSADAVRIVRTVGSPFVKLNWDLFHMQRAEGELIGNLRRAPETIAYVQLADTPDRQQPGTGDVNYANVIRTVREIGYDRPIGLEFWAKDGDYDQAVRDMVALSDAVGAA